jgi:hypothetical protein
MISRTSKAFRDRFHQLPEDVRRQARAAYRLWSQSPHHPSLQFKRVHSSFPIYSVRIGRSWRALGVRRDDAHMLWFWIGSHAEYDRLLSQL